MAKIVNSRTSSTDNKEVVITTSEFVIQLSGKFKAKATAEAILVRWNERGIKADLENNPYGSNKGFILTHQGTLVGFLNFYENNNRDLEDAAEEVNSATEFHLGTPVVSNEVLDEI